MGKASFSKEQRDVKKALATEVSAAGAVVERWVIRGSGHIAMYYTHRGRTRFFVTSNSSSCSRSLKNAVHSLRRVLQQEFAQ